MPDHTDQSRLDEQPENSLADTMRHVLDLINAPEFALLETYYNFKRDLDHLTNLPPDSLPARSLKTICSVLKTILDFRDVVID